MSQNERERERDRDESMWLCDISLHHFGVWWVCVNMSNYRETISESYALLCVRCIASYLSLCEALSSVPGPQQGWQSCKLIRHMCPVTVRFDRFSGWWSFCGSLFMLLPQPLPEPSLITPGILTWCDEVIALGFRAGVQTVSESTPERCGYGDFYNWKYRDINNLADDEETEPPLPPGCRSSK